MTCFHLSCSKPLRSGHRAGGRPVRPGPDLPVTGAAVGPGTAGDGPPAADLRLGVGLGRPGPPWAGSPPRSAVSEFPRPPRPGSTRPARRQQPGSPAPATAGPGPDCPLPSLRHSKSVLNSNDEVDEHGDNNKRTRARAYRCLLLDNIFL